MQPQQHRLPEPQQRFRTTTDAVLNRVALPPPPALP